LPNFKELIAAPVWHGQKNQSTILRQVVTASHNRTIRNFILRDQFQIALPPEKNAIILPRKVGIGPVGVRP
jgi:hypothetical protein